MPALLTTNTKLLKGVGLPCYGVQLAPHTLSGHNVCPMASTKNTPANIEDCLEALEDGACVAVPFNVTGKKSVVPTQWQGHEVHDGDVDDRIWTRKAGTVIGLRFKGDVKNIGLGCSDYCIYGSGHGRFSNVQLARVARTKLLYNDRPAFFAQLHSEIERSIKKHGKIAVRMNVFSDIAWETRGYEDSNGETIFERYPGIQFYDYTKIPKRVQQFLKGLMPKNYHLSLSYNKVWYSNANLESA